MIVDRYGHRFLRILLPYHIFIESSLDLMGRRNIPNINQGLFLFPFLFLLYLLSLRNILLHIRHIQNLYSRYIHIHQLAVIDLSAHHSVKALLHTIAADGDPVGKVDHLPRNRLRPPAHETDLLILVLMVFGLFYLSILCFLYIVLMIILTGHLFSSLSAQSIPKPSWLTPYASAVFCCTISRNVSSDMIGIPRSFAFLFLDDADVTSLLIR